MEYIIYIRWVRFRPLPSHRQNQRWLSRAQILSLFMSSHNPTLNKSCSRSQKANKESEGIIYIFCYYCLSAWCSQCFPLTEVLKQPGMIWSRWLNHLTTSHTLQMLPESLMLLLHVLAVPHALAPHTPEVLDWPNLLPCNLWTSWFLYTGLWKQEETWMLWSRCKLHLSRA